MTSLPSASLRRHGPALLLILAAAAAARLWRLGTQVITSDESFSWRLAGYAVPDIVERTATDVHSPVYYVLLKGWLALAGTSVLGLRAPAVVLSLLAVAVCWRVLREVSPGPGALVAAAFVALHPLQVQQGRNARMYALGLVLTAVGTLVLARAVRGRASTPWIAWGVLSALLVSTHYYGAFTVVAQAVGALVLAGQEGFRRTLRGLVTAGVVTVVLLAPWLPTMVEQALRVQQDYWIPPVTGPGLGGALLHWVTGLSSGPLPLVAAGLLLALVVLAARVEPRTVAFFAIPALLPWALALAASALSGRPLLIERFTVFAHLGFALLVGVAWQVARPRALAVALLPCLLATSLLGLRHEWSDLGPVPPALPQAVEHLRAGHASGDVVVAESPRLLNKLLFYWRASGGADGLRASCEPTDLGGHYSHAAALGPGDVVRAPVDDLHVRRVWRVSERADELPPLDGARWQPGGDDLFRGGQGTVIRLVRDDRR